MSLIVAVIVSGITGYMIGVGKLLGGFPASLKAALFNMDNYVFTGSLIVLIFSIYISAVDEGNTAAIIMLNIFSSVIFSWLLTKKTSIKDFKEKEEELALRSYRHINYIESAANMSREALIPVRWTGLICFPQKKRENVRRMRTQMAISEPLI